MRSTTRKAQSGSLKQGQRQSGSKTLAKPLKKDPQPEINISEVIGKIAPSNFPGIKDQGPLPRCVVVIWKDAVHRFGWQDDSEFGDPDDDLCYSIGWLMKQTDDVIAIAQTVGIETHAQTIQIPAGMVIGVTEIEMGIDICPQALSKMASM